MKWNDGNKKREKDQNGSPSSSFWGLRRDEHFETHWTLKMKRHFFLVPGRHYPNTHTTRAFFIGRTFIRAEKKGEKMSQWPQKGQVPKLRPFLARRFKSNALPLSLCERGEKKNGFHRKIRENPITCDIKMRRSSTFQKKNHKKKDQPPQQKRRPGATGRWTFFFIVLRKKKLKMKWGGGRRGWLLGTL